MNIDTLINEKMNENEDKNKIDLIHRTGSVLNNYMLIKVNGKLLKNIKTSDMGFYNDFGKRNMVVKLHIPLDTYEITIHPDSKEKDNYKNK